MITLQNRYKRVTGFSDHTSGVIVSVAASVMGAAIIEKHITLSRTMKGTDQAGSLEERGLFKLIEYIRATEKAKGEASKDFIPSALVAKQKLARSITSRVKISAGVIITEEMLCLRSPGSGLSWKQRFELIGHSLKKDYPPNATIRIDDIERS